MFNSQSQNLNFQDEIDIDFISQPNEFSQLNFNDFTLPSQTQASQDHFGSQVRKRPRGFHHPSIWWRIVRRRLSVTSLKFLFLAKRLRVRYDNGYH